MFRPRDPNQLPAPAVKVPTLGGGSDSSPSPPAAHPSTSTTTAAAAATGPTFPTSPFSVAAAQAPATHHRDPVGSPSAIVARHHHQQQQQQQQQRMVTFKRTAIAPAALPPASRGPFELSPVAAVGGATRELQVVECAADDGDDSRPLPSARGSLSLRRAAVSAAAASARSPSPEPTLPPSPTAVGDDDDVASDFAAAATSGGIEDVSAVPSTVLERSVAPEFLPDHLLNNDDFIDRLVEEVRRSCAPVRGANGDDDDGGGIALGEDEDGGDSEEFSDADLLACLQRPQRRQLATTTTTTRAAGVYSAAAFSPGPSSPSPPQRPQRRCSASVSRARSRSPSPCIVEAVALTSPHSATTSAAAVAARALSPFHPPRGSAVGGSRAASPEPRAPARSGPSPRQQRARGVSPARSGADGPAVVLSSPRRSRRASDAHRSVSPAAAHPNWAARPVSQQRPAWNQRVPPPPPSKAAAVPVSGRGRSRSRSRTLAAREGADGPLSAPAPASPPAAPPATATAASTPREPSARADGGSGSKSGADCPPFARVLFGDGGLSPLSQAGVGGDSADVRGLMAAVQAAAARAQRAEERCAALELELRAARREQALERDAIHSRLAQLTGQVSFAVQWVSRGEEEGREGHAQHHRSSALFSPPTVGAEEPPHTRTSSSGSVATTGTATVVAGAAATGTKLTSACGGLGDQEGDADGTPWAHGATPTPARGSTGHGNNNTSSSSRGGRLPPSPPLVLHLHS